MKSKFLLTIPLFSILAALVVFFFSAVPSNVAEACLPCGCKDNRAINCYGGFHVNTIGAEGKCAIEVLGYDKEGKKGYKAIYASAKELAKLPANPEKNTLIEQYYEFALYKLTTGEYQVNVGPDENKKVYVVIWTGCPATNIQESNYVSGN